MHRVSLLQTTIACILVAGISPCGQASSLFSPNPQMNEIINVKIFEESLIPFGRPSVAETHALAKALDAYVASGHLEAVDPLQNFLQVYPNSCWRPSLQVGIGLMYRHTGYLTRALESWEDAWKLSKGARDPRQVGIAHRALGELAETYAGLGRREKLEQLLLEADNRSLSGLVTEKLAGARESLELMKVAPERTFRCGPIALAHIKALQDPLALGDSRFLSLKTTDQGTSLEMNLRWAHDMGLDLQMAKRAPGSSMLVPAMVHWKAGHFAAVLGKENGAYLVQDPSLGDVWISEKALDDESTGYALVPSGILPTGWSQLKEGEGGKVWGRGAWGPGRPDDTRDDSEQVPPPCGSSSGMPIYSFHSNVVSLHIVDTPVGYAPPRGTRVDFRVTYNQREYGQPQVFDYCNLGPKWTFNWLACLKDDTTKPAANVTMCYPGGGGLIFKAIGNWQYESENFKQAKLVRQSETAYTVHYLDGRQEHYTLPDRATGLRRIVLTKVVDRTGNATNLTWDAQLRLVGITDALGKVTTVSYELASDPLKITKVTDPFGRTAHFSYDANGYLIKITDAVGMASSFSYGPTAECPSAPADFIHAMTTPYGTTRFSMGESGGVRWLESENPLGQRDRLEAGSTYTGKFPVEPIPGIPELDPGYLNPRFGYRLSLYWDRRAYGDRKVDYSKAHIYQWGHGAGGYASGILVSEKKPLENRTWFVHTGDFWGGIAPVAPAPAARASMAASFQRDGLICGVEAPQTVKPRLAKPSRALDVAMAGSGTAYLKPVFEGSRALVTRKARLLGDGSLQLHVSDRDLNGNLSRTIDPMGRVTYYNYAPDGLKLLEVKDGAGQTLARSTYNEQNLPLTTMGADGYATTYTYNAWGQVTSITNPKNETTTMGYDAQGFLESITGSASGAATRFTYDAVGRVHTVTGPDQVTVTTDYDNLDRPTKVTYSDGTTEEFRYDRLDLAHKKDRHGRWTFMAYNPLRQLVEVRDPLGRVTEFDWCGCGSQLESLKDPLGRMTSWWRDLQGRVIGKRLQDGTQTDYAYDLTGRLVQRVDAKGQKTVYQYYADDNLAKVSYPNAQNPTPAAEYTYDAQANRMATSKGRFGTTVYTYHPIRSTPTPGAGRLASIQGPFSNSKISYVYDELGRITSRDINGVKEIRDFDALGRLRTVTNPLGQFGYTYQGDTNYLSQVDLPNGQASRFSYFEADQGHRLKDIRNVRSDQSVISAFGYTYDAEGQIKTWSQQADAAVPRTYTFDYDAANQLTRAVLNGGAGELIRQYLYGYDLAGNRTSEQIDDSVTTSEHNGTNQLTRQRKTPSSAARAKGRKAVPAPQGADPVVPVPVLVPSK